MAVNYGKRRFRAELSSKGDNKVVFKGLIAATASLALMATPAMSASAPAAAAATEVAPAGESAEGAEFIGGGNFVIVVLALIAAGLGLWALLDNGDDSPASP